MQWLKFETFTYFFLIYVTAISCNESKFKGSSDETQAKTVANPRVPQCTNSKSDADFVLAIDNSGSNARRGSQVGSDCPASSDGSLCGPTQREKMALSILDNNLLTANSRLSVVSYPNDDMQPLRQDWMNIDEGRRSELESNMYFTRNPSGMTPYEDGIRAAKSQFESLGQSDRLRYLFNVSDDGPTDKNPERVITLANELKKMNVKIITILVTAISDDKARMEAHRNYLASWGSSVYPDSLIDQLAGPKTGQGREGLMYRISDEVIPVGASSQLEAKFREIVAEKTTCI